MTTLKAGERTTVMLGIGEMLTVAANVGSTGSIWDIGNSEPGTPTPYSGTALTIGPYSVIREFAVECKLGQMDCTTSSVIPLEDRLASNIHVNFTLFAGGQRTFALPRGSVLAVAANSGAVGSITPINAGEPGTPVPYTGAAIDIGPFTSTRYFRAQCIVGNMALTSALYVPTSVDFIPIGQARQLEDAATTDFDAILVLSQSNGVLGRGLVELLDRIANPSIGNIMYAPTDTALTNKIVYAAEPLENETKGVNEGPTIGFAKSAAEHLLNYEPGLLNGKKVLLFRVAVGGTGFSNPTTAVNWVKGAANSLYDSSLAKIQAFLALYPRVQVRVVFEDIIEEDATQMIVATWRSNQLAFQSNWRTDLGIPDLPFVCATASPDVPSFTQRSADMRGLPAYDNWLAIADDYAGGQSGYGADIVTGDIGINDEAPLGLTQDATHFAAPTQRNFRGPRFVAAFKKALTQNNMGGVPTAISVPSAITDLSVTLDGRDSYATLSMTPPGASGGPSNGGAAIEGYITEVSTDGGTVWVPAPVRWCGKGRKLTGLTNGLTYKVRTKAYNRAGVATTWSNVVTVNPVAMDLNAGLMIRLAPSGGNTIVDLAGGQTVTKNATYGTDGYPYFALNASTGYAAVPTAGAAHTFTQVCMKPVVALAANKGLAGLWGSSAQVATILQHGSTSGANENMRAGPGASGATLTKAIPTANILNQVCYFHICIDDDGLGAGTKRFRMWFQGVLQATITGQAAIAAADRFATGLGSNGQTNSLAAEYFDISVWNNDTFQVNDDKIAELIARGPNRV
jgi:hypothetical protein